MAKAKTIKKISKKTIVKKKKAKTPVEASSPAIPSKKAISYLPVCDEKEIQSVFDYNIDAFSDTPDFLWRLDEIKEEIENGWELYAVKWGEEVIAAVFLKHEQSALLSKNTAIKMANQGSGFSHQIKSFVESKAKELGAKKIFHYCRIDNFRMYSLNEGHGYKKTNQIQPDPQVVEWVKVIK